MNLDAKKKWKKKKKKKDDDWRIRKRLATGLTAAPEAMQCISICMESFGASDGKY